MSAFYIPCEQWLGFHLFLKEKHADLKLNTPVEELKLLWNEYVYSLQAEQEKKSQSPIH